MRLFGPEEVVHYDIAVWVHVTRSHVCVRMFAHGGGGGGGSLIATVEEHISTREMLKAVCTHWKFQLIFFLPVQAFVRI